MRTYVKNTPAEITAARVAEGDVIRYAHEDEDGRVQYTWAVDSVDLTADGVRFGLSSPRTGKHAWVSSWGKTASVMTVGAVSGSVGRKPAAPKAPKTTPKAPKAPAKPRGGELPRSAKPTEITSAEGLADALKAHKAAKQPATPKASGSSLRDEIRAAVREAVQTVIVDEIRAAVSDLLS